MVINEIQSDPPDSKSFPAGFIELYNPLASAVDVSGWSFTRGISYVFPAGASIPARGYLVVAEAPALILQRFGAVALGPWIGGLANDGETVQLVDATGAEMDSVSYGLGFPWPTVGDDPERSMQLIHEGLDGNLGGSWRSAPPTPGARNAVTTDSVPPQVRQVEHEPSEPTSGQLVTITARVTDPDGVQAGTLDYQVVEPGS